MPVKAKSHRSSSAKADPTQLPAPVTSADRIVLEIRKFIAAAIFFNTQAAEKAGLGLTDMQLLHMLQLYGPLTPGRLVCLDGLKQRRGHSGARPPGEGGLSAPRTQPRRPPQPAHYADAAAPAQNRGHV